MWATILPIDVAKTRIQINRKGTANDVGLVTMLWQMWKHGGRHTLWSGLGPTLTRAFPANAAQWLVWEMTAMCLQYESP
jgi:hypothetical protein